MKKIARSRRLYSDMLSVCLRKQHRDTMQVILCCFLTALGICTFNTATAKSSSAISRFLNDYNWSIRTLIRTLRRHALETLQEYWRGRRGRPSTIEIIVDTTSIAKEGQFAELDDWIHTLNQVRGLHVVMLYICCGELRLPYSFKIWRGKNTPSTQDLAFRLVRQLPKEILSRARQIHFLGDAGFSSVSLLQSLDQMGIAFTVGMRADRQTVDGIPLKQMSCQGRKVQLRGMEGLDLWLHWIWLYRCKEPEQRFIVTNRPRTPAWVRKIGRKRWKIEALFKTLKSRFAFGKFAQHSKKGVFRYLWLSLVAFLLCHFEQLDTQEHESGQEVTSWPDWKRLAKQVTAKLLGWVRLFELERERQQILANWDENFLNFP